MASNTIALAFVFFIHFVSLHVSASDAVIEDGYAVTTVIDGPKMKINPHAVIFNPGPSDLVILDSTGSAFYTTPFPVSQDSVIKLLSGGEAGYKDGEPGSVRFNKPRSFAIDIRGNIYVADRNNNVIRKIATSGVTSTIAGVNKITGRADGPAQNATFSNDFELVFAAERCALLVSDHGNQLVRQIDLKTEDCKRDSGSGNGKLANSIWGTAVGVALLVGCAVGFIVRPFVFTHQGMRINGFSETWKLCLITNPWKLIAPTLCSATRSAIANFSLVCLFFKSLLFRIDRVSSKKQSPPLLDIDQLSDISNSSFSISAKGIVSDKYADQLKDLIPFDGRSGSLNRNESDEIGCDVDLSSSFADRSLESMIKTNVMHFSGVSVIKETSNLVRRK